MRKLNPGESYIAISRTAGDKLKELLEIPDTTQWVDFKRFMIAAISETAEPVEGTTELHFLARVHVKNESIDKEVVLICAMTEGSPGPDFKDTVMIRGAMSVEKCEELIRTRKGLASLKRDPGVAKIGDAAGIKRKREAQE